MAKSLAEALDNYGKVLEKYIKLIEEQEAKYNNFINNADKVENDLSKMIGENIKSAADAIYRGSIDKFYSDYNPEYYDRSEQIYNMYDIEIGDGIVTINYGPDKAPHKFTEISSFPYSDPTTQHRVDKKDTSYIFNQAWMKGFHGGATPTNKKDRLGRSFPKGNQVAYRWPTMSMEYIDDRGRERHIPRFSLWSKRKDIKSEPIEDIKSMHLTRFKEGNKNNYSNTTKREIIRDAFKEVYGRKYGIVNLERW